jgi:biopolymer transport protein ExbD
MNEHESITSGRRALRRGPARLTVTFTPLIDIVFLLLLYFMLVAQFKTKEEMFQLDLPREGENETIVDPFALPSEPIRLRVSSTGDGAAELVIQSDDPVIGSPATVNALAAAAEQARGAMIGADQLFLVQPDEGARWEHALAVVNAIKRAGLQRVHLLEPEA